MNNYKHKCLVYLVYRLRYSPQVLRIPKVVVDRNEPSLSMCIVDFITPPYVEGNILPALQAEGVEDGIGMLQYPGFGAKYIGSQGRTPRSALA